jgi:hypothetical protein
MDCVKNIKHLAQEVPPQFIGEYVLLNGTAAYLPSDGSKKPDL